MLDVVLSNRFKKDLKLAAKSLFGHLEPHRFLHSFAGSLAFGSILCYTVFSRKVRAFTALLGFEYRVSAFLLLFYLSGIIRY